MKEHPQPTGHTVSAGSGAEMSVVLITRATYQSIRKTVRYLRQQTARDRLEVVIVAPSRQQLAADESELRDFAKVQVVELGPCQSMARARAEAVRHASTPVIAFGEDHAYPAPDWAALLIEAHRQDYVAVGPAIQNANPRSLLSWVNYAMCFARWCEPVAAGPTDALPWHNTSYKREALLEYGCELPSVLAVEGFLQDNQRAKGRRLCMLPAAKVAHVNISLLSSLLKHAFLGGCTAPRARDSYGGPRRGGWSTPAPPR